MKARRDSDDRNKGCFHGHTYALHVLHENSLADDAQHPGGGTLLSIGFWICLIVSGALLAAVCLAPRLAVRMQLTSAVFSAQTELLTLQSEVLQLAEVERALQRRGSLAARMASEAWPSTDQSGWSLPVEERLRFDVKHAPPGATRLQWKEPWYGVLTRRLARSEEQRRVWTAWGVGLLAFGFLFLQENGGSRAIRRTLAWPLRSLAARYRHSADEDLTTTATSGFEAPPR